MREPFLIESFSPVMTSLGGRPQLNANNYAEEFVLMGLHWTVRPEIGVYASIKVYSTAHTVRVSVSLDDGKVDEYMDPEHRREFGEMCFHTGYSNEGGGYQVRRYLAVIEALEKAGFKADFKPKGSYSIDRLLQGIGEFWNVEGIYIHNSHP